MPFLNSSQREYIYTDISSKICKIHKLWSNMTSGWSLKGHNRGLCPLISKFLHHTYQDIGFLGWGVQKWHLISNKLWEIKMRKWSNIWTHQPIKPIFWYAWSKKIFLSFDLWGEVRGHFRQPLKGHNEKLMQDLKYPCQKTYILICMKQQNT